MRYRFFFLFICLGLLLSCSEKSEELITPSIPTAASIQKQLGQVPIAGIKASPIEGLYEVQSGDGLFYVNRDATYLVSGHIIEMKTKKDLTAARLVEINRVDFSTLPLDDAIVSGDPNGIPVAVFTDPECPYCKKLETMLRTANGMKIYTFLYPLAQLHPQSIDKSKAIWCAEDRHAALLAVMLENKDLPTASCADPITRNVSLGQSLGISGTPTLISSDGRKHPGGFVSNKAMLQWAKAKP